jgi:hypothetical protein
MFRTSFSVTSLVMPEAFLGQQIHNPPPGCSRWCALGSIRASSAREEAKQTITSSGELPRLASLVVTPAGNAPSV